ncbi:uncharacterized protein [Rutidosis leptorrhynchoides]|uniref:uncharacterized protein n=1 Tax=Rutidosis leptorrhynchoides TaxID=125765 RepID=UPI003A9A08DD
MDNFDSERLHADNESLWNSVSLGFLATGIFISMFLIIAIIEQFFRPNASLIRFTQHANHRLNDPRPMNKVADPQPQVQAVNTSDLSVLMPGHMYPTYIAHPTPIPCSREGIYWPSHCLQNSVNL